MLCIGRALGLALPALQDLEARLTDAKGLSEQAQELLRQSTNLEQIPALQELRDKAAVEPIAITELKDIDRRLEGLAWEARVRKDFASCLSAGAVLYSVFFFCALFYCYILLEMELVLVSSDPENCAFFGLDKHFIFGRPFF